MSGKLPRRRVRKRPSAPATTIPRAANCGSSSASPSVATGVTQASTPSNARIHSSSVRAAKTASSAARTFAPGSPVARWPATRSGRPIVAHSARQNFASSAPTASQRPSRVG
jgi:hypothetical protein